MIEKEIKSEMNAYQQQVAAVTNLFHSKVKPLQRKIEEVKIEYNHKEATMKRALCSLEKQIDMEKKEKVFQSYLKFMLLLILAFIYLIVSFPQFRVLFLIVLFGRIISWVQSKKF